MRKNLSLVLVVALIFTISGTTVWGSPISWKNDFSDLTGPIESTDGYRTAYRQQNTVPTNGVMKCEPAAGIFQKEENDISFKMEYDGSKVETSTDFNPNVVIDPASADKTTALKISADEKVHYRTAFALGDKNYSDFGLVGKGILENGKVDFTSGNIMNVGK